jgi:hypothetical protein
VEQIHDYENTCTRYLLGELSEHEQVQLEETYFADDLLFERFLAVKDDLIDAYARGDLTGKRRELFEQHFLATEPRRQRVNEARDFIRAATAASTNAATENTTRAARTVASNPSWWQSISHHVASRPLILRGALAALLLLVLAGSWALVRHFQRQQAQRDRLQSEAAARQLQDQQPGRSETPPAIQDKAALPENNPTNPEAPRFPFRPPNKSSKSPMPSQVASLVLLPFSSRGDNETKPLLVQPDTHLVSLHLAFKGDDYRSYDIVLRTLDGEEVLHRPALQARSSGSEKSVTLTLNPSIFRHQDYIATLNGQTAGGKLEAIGDYYFRVERSAPQSTAKPNR